MFFIFASPRSGTTLLASCLNLHSSIVVPHETDFLVPLCFVFDRIKNPEVGKKILKDLIPNTSRFSYTIEPFLSRDEICSIIEDSPYEPRQLVVAIYDRIAKSSGKIIAGDKSPNDLLNIYMFASLGIFDEDVRVIHLVRDIRDVVLSLQQVKWVAKIEEFFPRFWCDSNLYLFNFFRNHLDRYLLIKYEDLVREPILHFEKICDFLSIQFEQNMLEKENRGKWYWKFDYHQKLKSDFNQDRVGVWERELDSKSVELCQIQAREALDVFGY